MPTVFDDFSPEGLSDAIIRGFNTYTMACVRVAGGEVHKEPGITWVATSQHLVYFNGVLQTTLDDADIEHTIAERIAFFRQRGQRMAWWVTPTTRPRDLSRHLEAAGVHYAFDNIGMAIDLHTVAESLALPPGLTIEPVRDLADLRDWTTALGQGFDMTEMITAYYYDLLASVPPAEHPVGPFFIGKLDGVPVATSAFFADEGIAGTYEVCTIPVARGKGIGTAMTWATLDEGRRRGYRVGVIHASQAGEPIYRRLGFEAYCTLDGYRWQP